MVVLKCVVLYSISKILILKTVCNCRSTSKKQLANCIIFTLLLSHLAFAFFLVVGELNFNTFSLGRLNKQSGEVSE